MAVDTQFDEVMLMLPECIREYHQYLTARDNSSSAALRAECIREMDKFYKSLRVSSDEVNPLSQEFFIMYAQYAITKKTDGVTGQLVQFNRLHNQAKYYIHKIIKNELSENGKQPVSPIHDYAESQYLLERSRGIQVEDKDSYLVQKREEIYAEIQKGFLNNREVYLVEYLFFKSLTPKLQISYYLNDLNWFLVRNFGSSLSNYKDSIITKYPSMHIEYGTFSPSSASMQPNKLRKEENKTGEEHSEKLYYERPSAKGSSNTKVYITNGVTFPQALEENTKLDEVFVNKAVSEMFLGSDNWKMASLPLDARDLTLLIFEYNLITPKVIKEFRIQTTLKEATKFLYPNYKKLTRREYEDTLKRIVKINHYIINATKEREDGTLEIVNLPLYASKVTLTPKNKQKRNITASNVSSINFEEYNLYDATIEFYPSAAQLQAWQEGANGIILTEKYKEVVEFSSRQLLLVFQSERLDMFPETKKKYPFSFFMEHMNAVNMKLNIFKRKLLGMLDTLSKYDVIEHYEVDPLGIDFGITINFCEFSDIEKKVYNLYSEQDSETELGSRIVAEQIDGQLFIPL